MSDRQPIDEVRLELPVRADDMVAVVEVFDSVWGSTPPVVTVELLTAVAHGGGYVALARAADGRPVGASLGLLARHDDAPALHSHVTGLVEDVRGTGVGRALKLHQRDWAAAHGLDRIVWTFDPLVRRNAWFNLEVLGAEAREYLPSFYGTMSDAINAGDRSDRLLVVWDVHRPVRDAGEVGTTPASGAAASCRRRPTSSSCAAPIRPPSPAGATRSPMRCRARSPPVGRSSDSPGPASM